TEAALGTETLQVIENDLMKVTFTNKGAQIKSVELKNYKDGNGKQVILADKNLFSYTVNTASSQSAQTGYLFFTADSIVKNINGNTT
ncbi:YidC/Oxa1 family insertase periplasmic-domain containing protein, partial [Acinetobacter baumannii]